MTEPPPHVRARDWPLASRRPAAHCRSFSPRVARGWRHARGTLLAAPPAERINVPRWARVRPTTALFWENHAPLQHRASGDCPVHVGGVFREFGRRHLVVVVLNRRGKLRGWVLQRQQRLNGRQLFNRGQFLQRGQRVECGQFLQRGQRVECGQFVQRGQRVQRGQFVQRGQLLNGQHHVLAGRLVFGGWILQRQRLIRQRGLIIGRWLLGHRHHLQQRIVLGREFLQQRRMWPPGRSHPLGRPGLQCG